MALLPSGLAKTGVVPYQIYPKTISQSLRFEDGDNANLSRTISTTSNKKTYTLSTWIKLGNFPSASTASEIFTAGITAYVYIRLDGNDNLQIGYWTGSTNAYRLITTQVFRDPSAWYHIVVAVDTTQATSSNRVKLYVNGEQVTDFGTEGYPSLDYQTTINTSGHTNYIGTNYAGSNDFDGYLAEVHFTDGTAYEPTDFGELKSGIWVPKEVSVTYGTNGFYLDFADSAAIGDDESGNTNDWTVNNLVASDVVPDSPTNNFCTLNPLYRSYWGAGVLSEGNSKWYQSGDGAGTGTFFPSTGKWYFEVLKLSGTGNNAIFGIIEEANNAYLPNNKVYYRSTGGDIVNYGTTDSTGLATLADDDIVGVSYDLDTGDVEFFKNNVSLGSTTIASGNLGTGFGVYLGNGNSSASDAKTFILNCGQDSTFAGNKTAGGNSDANGIGDFAYAPPSGYLALCTANLPDPVIDPAQEATADQHFNVYTYTGNGASQLIGDLVREIPDTYPISQSLRFEYSFDSPYLNRTPTSTSNRKTWTFSAWVKRANLGTMSFWSTYLSLSEWAVLQFDSSNRLRFVADGANIGGSGLIDKTTSARYTDSSAWYHIVVALDTTDATAEDRCKIYVNGLRITNWDTDDDPTLDDQPLINEQYSHKIGRWDYTGSGQDFDGYMAEVHFTDGTAYDADTFGVFDADGLWRPIEPTVTYGTNGFHLDFADSADIGDDNSGNTNDWTPNNFAATDVVIDTPTNSFTTLSTADLIANNGYLAEGNLLISDTTSNYLTNTRGTSEVRSGKWYYEVYNPSAVNQINAGWIANDTVRSGNAATSFTNGPPSAAVGGYSTLGYMAENIGATFNLLTGSTGFNTTGQVLGIAYDADEGKLYFSIDGVYQNSGDPAAGTGWLVSHDDPQIGYRPFLSVTGGGSAQQAIVNFGQDSTYAGNETAASNADENGYGEFQYAPPTGFLALCENNLIQYDDNPLESPDFVWIKARVNRAPRLYDSVRGVGNGLISNATNAEAFDANGLTGFHKNGFTVGSTNEVNYAGNNFVAWAWKAGGTAVANTDGSINSQVSANTEAGFSIVAYNGTQVAGDSVGHGLSQAPEMIIVKKRGGAASNWMVYHKGVASDAATDHLHLNLTDAAVDSSADWNDQAPTSSVFYLGNGTDTNDGGSGGIAHIAYCFHSVDGFSKVGSFVGNGNADGTFVYTGFRPKWIMYKHTATTVGWLIYDTERDAYNVMDSYLYASASDSEGTVVTLDAVSNGFKLRTSNSSLNQNGYTYVYLAFAEQPFKYSNAR